MQVEEQKVLRRLCAVWQGACVRLLSSVTEEGVFKLRGSVYTELEQGDFLLSRSVDGTGERLSSRSAGVELIVVHICGIRFLMSCVNQCLEVGFGAGVLGNPSEERFAVNAGQVACVGGDLPGGTRFCGGAGHPRAQRGP